MLKALMLKAPGTWPHDLCERCAAAETLNAHSAATTTAIALTRRTTG
jgi:hypothetical protein